MPKRLANDFTERVRAVVRQIPVGEVRSYQNVAILAGKPKAYRVVARIMSQNYDKDVPCHRVIHSDGRIGNYNRGGEVAKRARLIAEGWNEQPEQS